MDTDRPAPPLWTLTQREPGDLAITDGRRALTWAELDAETNAFGHGLLAHGLGPGDHVSVVARNHVEYLVAIIGTQRAGMVVTPVKPAPRCRAVTRQPWAESKRRATHATP